MSREQQIRWWFIASARHIYAGQSHQTTSAATVSQLRQERGERQQMMFGVEDAVAKLKTGLPKDTAKRRFKTLLDRSGFKYRKSNQSLATLPVAGLASSRAWSLDGNISAPARTVDSFTRKPCFKPKVSL